MIQAAIYARYSTDQQRDASIEDQVRLCRERAVREGWQVAEVYADAGLSGASLMRPCIQQLMKDCLAGKFTIVLAEALDRLSRDQEDIAGIYKRLRFAGVSIITLSEGEVGDLHIGLKGTMNALFLKDLADKTRRGLRGRVEAGKSGGGNSYGYDVVKRFAADGTPLRGDRSINEAQATRRPPHFHRLRRRQINESDRKAAQPGRRSRPDREGMGAVHHPRQPRTRDRDSQQRTLCRAAGLEPAALPQRPGHRQARVAAKP
jgi:DNA invertase Pin-like site-specific DNA recombinase